MKWVADQLGHADPALTLRVYAHAMKSEEKDLSFLDFGGPGRPYTAPEPGGKSNTFVSPRNSGLDGSPGFARFHSSFNAIAEMVGRQGLEPWTIGLRERSRRK